MSSQISRRGYIFLKVLNGVINFELTFWEGVLIWVAIHIFGCGCPTVLAPLAVKMSFLLELPLYPCFGNRKTPLLPFRLL